MTITPKTLGAEAGPSTTEVNVQESVEELTEEAAVEDEELPLLHRTTRHPSHTFSISRILNRTRHVLHVTSKTNLLRKVLPTLLTLLPSPLHHLLAPHTYPGRSTEFRPTAYLDGLRGIASWLVLIFHYTLYPLPELMTYYGLSNDPKLPPHHHYNYPSFACSSPAASPPCISSLWSLG